MERNIAKMQRACNANKIAVRPHAKTHKCAAIAKMQMAAGAIGICTAKLSEAEALFAEGIDRILMTTANLPPTKIRRAMELKKRCPGFVQAVDYDVNARELNDAAKAAGVVADVVIDVAVGTRSGIPPGEDAIKLAQLVDKSPSLKLRGLLSYDGGAQHVNTFAARKASALKNIEENARAGEDETDRAQHRDLQRRRHGHLQHLSPRPGIHRRPGRQLHLHGHAYVAIGNVDGQPIYDDFGHRSPCSRRS
jgi:D-serine deaminase-like pyridoxal phosphate-dependent protein